MSFEMQNKLEILRDAEQFYWRTEYLNALQEGSK